MDTRNLPVNPAHKRIRRQKPNRPRQQAINPTSQESIYEEQKARHEALDMQFGEIVPDQVAEDPDAAAAADEKRLPPPVVILIPY
jgi:hypothetical protein